MQNRGRKREYLIGEALDLGADTLVTRDAGQSNHFCQTAAAAAMVGLECHLAIGGEKPAEISGNPLREGQLLFLPMERNSWHHHKQLMAESLMSRFKWRNTRRQRTCDELVAQRQRF